MRKSATNFRFLSLLLSFLVLPMSFSSALAADPETTTIEIRGAAISGSPVQGSTNAEKTVYTSNQTSPTGVMMTLEGGATFSYSSTYVYCKLQNPDWSATFTPTDDTWYVSKVEFKSKAPSGSPVMTVGNGESVTLKTGTASTQYAFNFTEGQPATFSFAGCTAPTTSNAASPFFLNLKVTLTKKAGTGSDTTDPNPDPDPDQQPAPISISGPDPTPSEADITLQVNPSAGTFANNFWKSTATSPAGATVTVSAGTLTYSNSYKTPVVTASAASATVTLASTVDGWYVCGYSFSAINAGYGGTTSIDANGTAKTLGTSWSGTPFTVTDIPEGTPAAIVIANTSSNINVELNNLTLILRKGKGSVTPTPGPDPTEPEPADDTVTIKINSTTGGGSSTVWNSTAQNPGIRLTANGASLTYNADNVYADFQSGKTSGSFTLSATEEWYVTGYSFKAVGNYITVNGNGKSAAASFSGAEIKVTGLDKKTPAVINYTFAGYQASQKNIQLKDFTVTLKKLPRFVVKAYTLRSADGKALAEIPSTGFLSLTETVDPNDPAQLWVIETKGDRTVFTIRNYLTAPLPHRALRERLRLARHLLARGRGPAHEPGPDLPRGG